MNDVSLEQLRAFLAFALVRMETARKTGGHEYQGCFELVRSLRAQLREKEATHEQNPTH